MNDGHAVITGEQAVICLSINRAISQAVDVRDLFEIDLRIDAEALPPQLTTALHRQARLRRGQLSSQLV